MENPITIIYDNIKEKTASPFFSSLIFVWFVRNWDLIFTILYFDKSFTLDEKIKRIDKYYSNKIFICELGTNIFYASLLMVLGYILIIGTKVLINFGENKVIPYFFSKTVSKTVVQKIFFEDLQSKYEANLTEIVAKSKLLQDIENFNTNLKVENKSLVNSIESKESEIMTLKNASEILEVSSKSLADIIDSQKESYTEINKILSETREVEKKLHNEKRQRINDFHFFLNFLISDFENPTPVDIKKQGFSHQIKSRISILQKNERLLSFFREFIINSYALPSKSVSYNKNYLAELKDIGIIAYNSENENFYRHENIHLTYFGNFMASIFNLHPLAA